MIRIDLDVMMARRKMSLTELARRVGITNANMSILKTGHAKAIRLSTLDSICKVLNCQPGDIIVWVPDDDPLGELPATGHLPVESLSPLAKKFP